VRIRGGLNLLDFLLGEIRDGDRERVEAAIAIENEIRLHRDIVAHTDREGALSRRMELGGKRNRIQNGLHALVSYPHNTNI